MELSPASEPPSDRGEPLAHDLQFQPLPEALEQERTVTVSLTADYEPDPTLQDLSKPSAPQSDTPPLDPRAQVREAEPDDGTPEPEGATERELASSPLPDPDAFDDDEPTVMRPGESLVEPPAPAFEDAALPPTPTPEPFVAPVPSPRPTAPTSAARRSARGGGSFLPSVFLLLCALGGTLLGFALFFGPTGVQVSRAGAPNSEPVLHSEPPAAEPTAPSPQPQPSVEPAVVSQLAVPVEPPPSAEPDAQDASVGSSDEEPAPALGGMAEFTVDSDQLRKLQVRCADASAAGASPLQVELTATSACTVTAIYDDRSRATAVLEAAAPGQSYGCFEGGANLCQPR